MVDETRRSPPRPRSCAEWLLKGGTGVLARVASGRCTTDVDLFRANYTLDGAFAELIRLAAIGLGDCFRFVYTRHRAVVGGDQQTYTEGCGVDVDVDIGADRKEPLHVDLVAGVIVTDEVTVAAPANRRDLPRLPSNDYRFYSVVDQSNDTPPQAGVVPQRAWRMGSDGRAGGRYDSRNLSRRTLEEHFRRRNRDCRMRSRRAVHRLRPQ
ncbi:hypothetical protein [Agromyces larvae]|uniref:Nucleotidyl transferase AbiEii/AbiGii toxin family protein n=1 Tax=Agromyces larvae TaxID=2929802 RepID=A0ABY4BU35_9MICO|nr:hypothetical protein [Agromyces larvae]UOE42726.1 hypothetical protein MTO99_11040 [Agromyces larvae]